MSTLNTSAIELTSILPVVRFIFSLKEKKVFIRDWSSDGQNCLLEVPVSRAGQGPVLARQEEEEKPQWCKNAARGSTGHGTVSPAEAPQQQGRTLQPSALEALTLPRGPRQPDLW